MGKMKKEKLDALRREDVKENNWEIEDSGARGQDSGVRGQDSGASNEEERGTRSEEREVGGQVLSEVTADDKKDYQAPEELKEIFDGIPADLAGRGELKKRLHEDWLKVDPAIRVGNPVWKYSIKDDKMMCCTVFLFRSGQKVRIFTPVEVVNS